MYYRQFLAKQASVIKHWCLCQQLRLI